MQGLREWAMAQAAQCSSGDFLERYRGPTLIYKNWYRQLMERERRLCTPGRAIMGCSYDGSLYPCRGYIGVERWRLGDVRSGIDQNRLTAFIAECLQAESHCDACPAKLACEKPCPASYPESTPTECVARDCESAKNLTALLQESFARLRQTD
jgi:radical SAM protein with 4Fe4S-binding SPASM domain